MVMPLELEAWDAATKFGARANVFAEESFPSWPTEIRQFPQNILHIFQLSFMMLGKRKTVQTVPPPRKKRKSASAIEEISFDFSAREDYLTGFHKRKLLRIKHAKEEAAKKDREDKLAARKIVWFTTFLPLCGSD